MIGGARIKFLGTIIGRVVLCVFLKASPGGSAGRNIFQINNPYGTQRLKTEAASRRGELNAESGRYLLF
jgi:hypothetical protein